MLQANRMQPNQPITKKLKTINLAKQKIKRKKNFELKTNLIACLAM